VLSQAIKALEDTRGKMDAVYGPCASASAHFNVLTGEGTLQGLIEFVGA
jgi:CRISPR system Cascade subunit CasC